VVLGGSGAPGDLPIEPLFSGEKGCGGQKGSFTLGRRNRAAIRKNFREKRKKHVQIFQKRSPEGVLCPENFIESARDVLPACAKPDA